MTCALCSASILAPLVPGGVSARTIGDRARRAADRARRGEMLTIDDRAAIYRCADTLEWMAAEIVRRDRETEG